MIHVENASIPFRNLCNSGTKVLHRPPHSLGYSCMHGKIWSTQTISTSLRLLPHYYCNYCNNEFDLPKSSSTIFHRVTPYEFILPLSLNLPTGNVSTPKSTNINDHNSSFFIKYWLINLPTRNLLDPLRIFHIGSSRSSLLSMVWPFATH